MKILIADAAGRSAASVMHPTITTLPADATIDDLRAYFATSSSRRLAVLVDGERYVGAIGLERLDELGDAAGTDLARTFAVREPVVAPDAPATEARDLALSTAERRVPVVAEDGRYIGVVAVDKLRAGFCGTDDAE